MSGKANGSDPLASHPNPQATQADEPSTREESLAAAAGHVFRGLPKIVATLVSKAEGGDLAAAKLVVELAGLRDAIQSLATADAVDENPLEASLIERLRTQIEAMPDKPDPLTFKW